MDWQDSPMGHHSYEKLVGFAPRQLLNAVIWVGLEMSEF